MFVKIGVFGGDNISKFFLTKFLYRFDFESDPNFEVVNCDGLTRYALRRAGLQLVIVDYQIIDRKTIEFLNFCCAELPNLNILIFVRYKLDQELFQRMANNRFYYFDKSLSGKEFELLFHELVINSDSLNDLSKDYKIKINPKRMGLSRRESQIANLLSVGLKNHEICELLNLSASTISTYTKRIFRKLKINNIIQLAETLEKAKLTSNYY